MVIGVDERPFDETVLLAQAEVIVAAEACRVAFEEAWQRHPELRPRPCRSLGCTEVIGLWSDMTVDGVPGFCRGCYERLTV